MRPSSSLRFRVAAVFAAFGALLSILLSVGLYFTAQQIGHKLMDEALQAQLLDSAERHMTDAIFLPPNTVSIKAYYLSREEGGHYAPPPEISKLAPGSYNVKVGALDYRVLVDDKNGFRYFMLFDTDRQHKREENFFHFLAYFALLMTLASAAGGFWLALRVISPLSRLAVQLGQTQPGDSELSLEGLNRDDEVGELARTFARYQQRMQEFIRRENYFTADVSHELRTPIAIVLGTVEVLEQDETLTPKQRERVTRIRRAAQDMADLTSALLLLSREQRLRTDENLCYVSDVVQACVDKHKHLIGNRVIRLELEFVDEPYLNVERPLLEIVIANLLRNAFFNMQSGVVSLRLEARRFVLSDTGCGMSHEVQEHIFERHFKGAASSGAGVGLSLVKRICDRYGWRISVASEPGQGTTIEVAFA